VATGTSTSGTAAVVHSAIFSDRPVKGDQDVLGLRGRVESAFLGGVGGQDLLERVGDLDGGPVAGVRGLGGPSSISGRSTDRIREQPERPRRNHQASGVRPG
jgi:hypothetical protein